MPLGDSGTGQSTRAAAGGGVLPALLLVVGATGCLAPPRPAASGLVLELPRAVEHWRAGLEASAAALQFRMQLMDARWPEQAPGTPPRLIVTADLEAARTLYRELGLDGDPRVARSFPARRLAVVALPRADPLLWRRERPPLTWRETFLHECAHLWSLDRPGLRTAPAWFQEGLAELLAAGQEALSSAASGDGALRAFLASGGDLERPLLDLVEDAAGELRLAAWRRLAAAALEVTAADPWSRVQGATGAEVLALLASAPLAEPAFAGREVDVESSGDLLLAAWPGEFVSARAASLLADGASARLRLQLGSSGSPEAGLIVSSGGERELRLRLSRYGGIGATLEARGEARTGPLADRPTDGRIGAPRNLELAVLRDRLRLRSGDWTQEYAFESGTFRPPFRIEFYVQDGVLDVQVR